MIQRPSPSVGSILSLLLCVSLGATVVGCGDDDGTGEDGSGNGDGGGGAGDGGLAGDASGLGCEQLPATIRDFSQSHPDFEMPTASDVPYPGLVESTLGPDDKPVYAHPGATPFTTGPAEFNQWFNDVSGVNQTFPRTIDLTLEAGGVYVFEDWDFFPIDGMGFGNEGQPHNFWFTTEIHTNFTYRGGETFTFTGDDDLWLFINGRLAIDLGGLHPRIEGSVDLDAQAAELGLVIGETYPMDIFHAERHTDASNFRVETTIDCFVID